MIRFGELTDFGVRKRIAVKAAGKPDCGLETGDCPGKFAKLDEETIRNTEAVVCNNDDMALGVYDYYKNIR